MKFLTRHTSIPFTLSYGGAAILSAAVFAYVHSMGLVNVFADAKSHMLQSIQMLHSLTPGISQLGFWPPLLHLILLPAAVLLPRSMMLDAGAFITMLPLLLGGAYFTYGICRLSDVGPRVALIAPVLFLLHPFVQYFASSAMAELPLIVTVLGSAYYALRWTRNTTLLSLSLFGIFVSLASLSRFEGFALVPLSIAFTIVYCLSVRMRYVQLKAIVVTFTFLAVLGVFFIVLYSMVYAGSPTGFLTLGAERIGQSEKGALGGTGFSSKSILESLDRFYRASLYIHGTWAVPALGISTSLFLALRRRWQDLAIVLFLVSPALFILTMMSIGRNAISLPELPRVGLVGEPYGYFYNARFALTWVGGGIVGIVLAVDALLKTKFLRFLTAAFVIPGILLAAAAHSFDVLFVNDFDVIRRDEQALSALAQRDAHKNEYGLLPEYDGGRVLFTRFYSEQAMLLSNVPLHMYVHEGNYLYFEQALQEPWLFARWVIVRHDVPDQRGGNIRRTKLFVQMIKMEESPEFQHYFELVEVTPYLRYYKLRQHVLRDQALRLGYDPANIPSLNVGARWNPKTFYQELHAWSGR